MLLGGQTTDLEDEYLSTFPAQYVVQHWFQIANHLLTLQATLVFADEGCELIIQHGAHHLPMHAVCMLALCGYPMSNGANW